MQKIKVKGQTVKPGERTQTDGRYQVHYIDKYVPCWTYVKRFPGFSKPQIALEGMEKYEKSLGTLDIQYSSYIYSTVEPPPPPFSEHLRDRVCLLAQMTKLADEVQYILP